MQKLFLRKPGFTLIELLIVVAIIAILAAIAVPNFLEAQLRAKVARTKADMRTISLAIDSYVVDNNAPPHLQAKVGYTLTDQDHQLNRFGICCATNLTTPISYLTTVAMKDPFCPPYVQYDYCGVIDGGSNGQRPYTYYFVNIYGDAHGWAWGGNTTPLAQAQNHWSRYLLISLGPDYVKGPDQRPGIANPGGWSNKNYTNADLGRQWGKWIIQNYDPTNGTVSGGDILRWEGMGSAS